MEDYKLRDLCSSHTLGWSWNWNINQEIYTSLTHWVVYYESINREPKVGRGIGTPQDKQKFAS
jgi:hypothetical protein